MNATGRPPRSMTSNMPGFCLINGLVDNGWFRFIYFGSANKGLILRRRAANTAAESDRKCTPATAAR